MTERSEYVELTRVSDPVQADLLAAFLEDGDVEFQVVNRSGAGFMSQLIPRSANPVLFRILATDFERGKVLLEEYNTLQLQPTPSDDDALTGDDGDAEDLDDTDEDRDDAEDDLDDTEEDLDDAERG
ncbi:MAG: hypothetical protein JXX14_03095 [Deltaproteobacteria bacterium]|nr:hypothetical protein [Deltaproteobacteria bacterium]